MGNSTDRKQSELHKEPFQTDFFQAIVETFVDWMSIVSN